MGWRKKALQGRRHKYLCTLLTVICGISLMQGNHVYAIKDVKESEDKGMILTREEALIRQDSVTFTVFSKETKESQVTIKAEEKKNDVIIKVNGVKQKVVSLPEEDQILLKLNAGINTIEFEGYTEVEQLEIDQEEVLSQVGCTKSYVTYEAEECETNTTIAEENRTYGQIASEAVGRRFVRLENEKDFLSFQLKEPTDAITIRYCIPDSEDGQGLEETLNMYIDGKCQPIHLTSKYSWFYGSYPFTNIPSQGNAHHFFDEVRIPLDQTYKEGTQIRFEKGKENKAEYYIIDLIETEKIAPEIEKPENALSITDYGAVADDDTDDSKAFYDCLADAAKQGKEVWIPKGVFRIDQSNSGRGIRISEENTVIRGAGMWHSYITGDHAAFLIAANHTAFYDFSMIGTAIVRRDAEDPAAFETNYDSNHTEDVTIQNIYMQHYKVGAWTYSTDGIHIVGCRIRNMFADGINLCRGTKNSVIEQCSIRNTGDDCLAMWSQNETDYNNVVRKNQIEIPCLANNIALYGGKNITICDNYLSDTIINGAGINISTNFSPKSEEGVILIKNNSLVRCGSMDTNYGNIGDGAIWFNTVYGCDQKASIRMEANQIIDSSYHGISFYGFGEVNDVVMNQNCITKTKINGVQIEGSTRGFITGDQNQFSEISSENVNNKSEKTFQVDLFVNDEHIKTVLEEEKEEEEPTTKEEEQKEEEAAKEDTKNEKAKSKKSNTGTFVVIGCIVVICLIGVLFIRRGKKK